MVVSVVCAAREAEVLQAVSLLARLSRNRGYTSPPLRLVGIVIRGTVGSFMLAGTLVLS